MDNKLEAVASAVAMIRTMDVHEAAKAMAKKLKLNAEVRTCVGKWDERGSVAGWVTSGRTDEPASTLVEVFVSDLAGEDREFRRYARQMQEQADEITRLNAENERLTKEADDLGEQANRWRNAWGESQTLVDEMREGLEPFAKAEITGTRSCPASTPLSDRDVYEVDGLKVADFSRAVALITKASRDSGHG